MNSTLKTIASFAVIALVFTVGSAALGGGGKKEVDDACGASCCYIVPSKIDSGDEFYGSGNWDWCRSDYLRTNARAFGMSSKYWGGHGWNDACNSDNPTGRFFTSLVALSETSPDKVWPDLNDTDGNILRWGAGWAARVHDDLRASCAFSKTAIATASGTDHVTLWIPNNFYISGGSIRMVVSRASTLIHEARHINGKRHNGSDGKDSTWDHKGAWHFQASWLSVYAAEGVHAPLEQRCAAEDQANSIVRTRFETDPGFVWDNVDDALCP